MNTSPPVVGNASDASSAPSAASEPPPAVPPALSLHLFGTFALQVRGQPAPTLSRSARALLGLLATQVNNRSLARASVSATLWPESDEAVARYNLRRTLMEVRQALGSEANRLRAPQSAPHTIWLDLTSGTASGAALCDVVAFDAAIAAGAKGNGNEAALQAAVDLYLSADGAFLEGERAEWVYPERETRREAYLTVRERLAHHARERGARKEAIGHLKGILALDPTRETIVRDLMTTLSESGETAAALSAYQSLCVRLQKEANTAPDAETVALYKRLYHKSRQKSSLGATDTPPTTADEAASEAAVSPLSLYNIPRPLTALIGRERDTLEVTTFLSSDKDHHPARLLTLLGAGGVGKTRLALAVAEAVAPDYADGVCFVDFAPVSSVSASASTRLASVVAHALRLTEPANSPAPGEEARFLIDALQSRRLLLLLDNCEHVAVEAARLAMTLLRACPHLTILATSREPLHVPGEIIWRVPGLAQGEAARLFLARATEANFAFHPQMAQQEAVQAIVTRLDGIPLAIEMAAARTRALPVAEIAKRLDNAFRLLAVPGGDLLPRHRTLRATLDWSYDLLSAAEQTLLARLSVFAGGWTLAAAEAVCEGGAISQSDVFDLLAALIDKSLAQFLASPPNDLPGDAGMGRYRMLETIRQYAREKLAQSGEEQVTQERHRDWCLTLVEKAEPHLDAAQAVEWSVRLEQENDNLRAALGHCAARTGAAQNSPESAATAALAGLRLSGALWRFWQIRGYLSEGREHLARALTLAREATAKGELPETAAAKKATAVALNAEGILAMSQGDYPAAQALSTQSLSLFREIGETSGIGRALNNLGNVANYQHDYGHARPLYEESLRAFRELHNQSGVAGCLGNLAMLSFRQGDYDAAWSLFEEVMGIYKELHDQGGIAHTLNSLSNIALLQDKYDAAKSLAEESLSLFRKLDDKGGISKTLIDLGNAAFRQNDLSAAQSLYEESLVILHEVGDNRLIALVLNNQGSIALNQSDYSSAEIFLKKSLPVSRELGDKRLIAFSLDGMALVCKGIGETRRAALFWAATDTLRESLNTPLSATEKAERDTEMVAARAEMGDESAWAAAWAEGTALSWEQAVELALRDT